MIKVSENVLIRTGIPVIFHSSCYSVRLFDTAQIFDFDLEKCRANLKPMNPQMPVFPVSGKTGEGMEPFIAWLKERIHESH